MARGLLPRVPTAQTLARRAAVLGNAVATQAASDAGAVMDEVSAVASDVTTLNTTVGSIDGRLILVEDEVFP